MASNDCDPNPECDHTALKRNEDAFVLGKDANGIVDKKGPLLIGDGVYIVNLKTRDVAYQGENSVFLGDNKVFGYPFGIKTIPDIEQSLHAHWIKDAGKSSIGGVPNGPPGFVKDYYRADPNELKNLGNWVTTK
jgi:hypothetical protein